MVQFGVTFGLILDGPQDDNYCRCVQSTHREFATGPQLPNSWADLMQLTIHRCLILATLDCSFRVGISVLQVAGSTLL